MLLTEMADDNDGEKLPRLKETTLVLINQVNMILSKKQNLVTLESVAAIQAATVVAGTRSPSQANRR
jgi:hypothetical protein